MDSAMAVDTHLAVGVDPVDGVDSTATVNSVVGVGPDVTVDPTIKSESSVPQGVRVLNMGGPHGRKQRMLSQGRNILTLCRHSRDRITPDNAEQVSNRSADADLYLDWLDMNLAMTASLHSVAKVELVLTTLINPSNNVPGPMVNKAQALLSKFKEEIWEEDAVTDESDESSTSQSSPAAASSTATPPHVAKATYEVMQVPPSNDPVYGVNGLMYGILVDTSGKRKDYRLRPDIPRKSAKVYGHNGIALGTWYPFQINALFWGAHGARMAGIAGNVTSGAWSIVVAGTYEDLDTDNGVTIYYSGSNSHKNTNPLQAASPSQGTKALRASIRTQKPIRVLRSGGAFGTKNQNRYLPSCGLRYDGLYRVVHCQQRRNRNGGLYDQFKLTRLDGQTPLDELRSRSPTAEQVFAHDQIRGNK